MTNLQIEHLSNSLKRDFRNLERAVKAETSDSYIQAMLIKMNRTILETQRALQELSKK